MIIKGNFRRIHAEYRPKEIVGYLRRLVGDADAEDVAQEAFVQVQQIAGRVSGRVPSVHMDLSHCNEHGDGPSSKTIDQTVIATRVRQSQSDSELS